MDKQQVTHMNNPNLKQCRKHFGSQHFYFQVTFKGDSEPQLLNVDEVWKAHRAGKKATSFEATPLLTKEQQSFLSALASVEVVA